MMETAIIMKSAAIKTPNNVYWSKVSYVWKNPQIVIPSITTPIAKIRNPPIPENAFMMLSMLILKIDFCIIDPI